MSRFGKPAKSLAGQFTRGASSRPTPSRFPPARPQPHSLHTPPRDPLREVELSAELASSERATRPRLAVLDVSAFLRRPRREQQAHKDSNKGGSPWQRQYLLADADAHGVPSSSPAAATTSRRKRAVLSRISGANMNYVQIISAPTADTPAPCLLLHHDSRRYLFGNVGEGLQRATIQRKVGLGKAESVFLSGPTGWHGMGGLLGYVITMADRLNAAKESLAMHVAAAAEASAAAAAKAAAAGKERRPATPQQGQQNKKKKATAAATEERLAITSLNIHGPQNLAYLFATARRFIFRSGFPLNFEEVRVDPRAASPVDAGHPDWSDENVKVWYVPVWADAEEDGAHRPRSSSLGKRSHDEISGDEGAAGGAEVDTQQGLATRSRPSAEDGALPPGEQDRLNNLFVDNVVKEMFSSEWKLDTLVETTLHRARLPAKLFVRGPDGKIQRYAGPLPGDAGFERPEDVPDVPVLVRNPWPAAMVDALPEVPRSAQSLCYLVKNQPRRGKFNVARAKELGVPVPMFKLLTEGESVTTPEGGNVTPDMVIGEPVGGYGFVVADLPDEAYVDAFVARPEWADEKLMDRVKAVYWFLGPGMVADARIQAFMQRFLQGDEERRNFVLSMDTCPNMVAFESIADNQMKLHAVDPARFHIPTFDNNVAVPGIAELPPPAATPTTSKHKAATPGKLPQASPSSTVADNTASASTSSNKVPDTSNNGPGSPSAPLFYSGRTGATMQTGPQLAFKGDASHVVPFAPLADASATLDPAVAALAASARATLSTPSFRRAVAASNASLPHPDAEVVSLGTGSAMPSKYRSVSATLLRVPGHGSYLLDCGENTLGQLRRVYGEAGADDVIRDLRAVWISHLHADHHLGTAAVLRAWRDLTDADIAQSQATGTGAPQLAVIAHAHFLAWLREYHRVEDVGLSPGGRVRLCEMTLPASPGNTTGEREGTVARPLIFPLDQREALGLARVDAVRVDHCLGALACVLTFHGGLTVAYSGDCRPSDRFAALARDRGRDAARQAGLLPPTPTDAGDMGDDATAGGVTLLIHEATFEDGREGDATAKKHSTSAEALDVARRAGARRVLLTHFSQRYQKFPVLAAAADDDAGADGAKNNPDEMMDVEGGRGREAADYSPVVLMAFDYMRVKLADFKEAEAFVPALQKLFEDEKDDKEKDAAL